MTIKDGYEQALVGLAGVYRNGGNFIIFPDENVADWETVYQHEYTHMSLGISTSAGFIHQVLAFLATRGMEPDRPIWHQIYTTSLDRSIRTHEATATYCGLCADHSTSDRLLLYDRHQVPPFYQECHLKLDQVIPSEWDYETRILLATSIARYAMDLPWAELARIDPNEKCSNELIDLLTPRIDERFEALVNLLGEEPEILKEMAELSSLAIEVSNRQCERTVDLLKKRRSFTYQRSIDARDVMIDRYSKKVPSFPIGTGNYRQMVKSVLPNLKRVFNKFEDESLDKFTRTVDDDDEYDLIHLSGEVRLPSKPLHHLARREEVGFPFGPPTIICTGPVAQDCMLTDTLKLTKGNWYTRYFHIRRDRSIQNPTVYEISEQFPEGVGTNSILIRPGEVINLENYLHPHSYPYLVLTGTSINSKILSILRKQKTDWQARWFPLEHFGNVVVLLFVHNPRLRLCLFTLHCGSSIPIISDELEYLFETPLDRDAEFIVRMLEPVLEHVMPTEGVPV